MKTSHDTMRENLVADRVGPFMWVTKDEKTDFMTEDGRRTFRVLLYGAYNAMGLIGSESNGIAVLDEDQMQVLADELAKESSGYFGPSKGQREAYRHIVEEMTWPEFRDMVNASGRNRYEI